MRIKIVRGLGFESGISPRRIMSPTEPAPSIDKIPGFFQGAPFEKKYFFTLQIAQKTAKNRQNQ